MARKKVVLRQLKSLPLDLIQAPPTQTVRRQPAVLESAAQSLAERGKSPPLLVMERAGGREYRLVVGAIRLEAARRLAWREIDCIVTEEDSAPQLQIVERLQWGDFDPWELADALDTLKKRYGWTQEQVGMAIAKTRDFVANILAITQIAPAVREYIARGFQGGRLTARHLRYVARTPRSEQMAVAQRIMGQTLSTKELEREKRLTSSRSRESGMIRVRDTRKPGDPNYPRRPKEWRRYRRQLMTDLRRIDRLEVNAVQRAHALAAEAKRRLALTRSESNRKRRELSRELRQVQKQLIRMGE